MEKRSINQLFMLNEFLPVFETGREHSNELTEFTVIVRLVIITRFDQNIEMPEITSHQIACSKMYPCNPAKLLWSNAG